MALAECPDGSRFCRLGLPTVEVGFGAVEMRLERGIQTNNCDHANTQTPKQQHELKQIASNTLNNSKLKQRGV